MMADTALSGESLDEPDLTFGCHPGLTLQAFGRIAPRLLPIQACHAPSPSHSLGSGGGGAGNARANPNATRRLPRSRFARSSSTSSGASMIEIDATEALDLKFHRHSSPVQ